MCADCPKILICKLEPGREAEVAQSVKHHWDCTRMVRPRNFLAWSMRYVRRLPEKLICKLEPGREAEVARSVKKSSGLYAYGTSR